MFSRSVAIAALFLVPTLADAQGRRTFGRDEQASWDSIQRAPSGVPKVSKGDIQSLSAVKLVVEKRKDLKLSDEQLKQFKDLDLKEEAVNDALYKQVDSLKLAMKRRDGEDADQERARTTLARQELMTVIRQIRANYDSTFQASLPLLDETQKQTATQLVEKEREEADEDLRSKIGGGGARQSGSPMTRRRP